MAFSQVTITHSYLGLDGSAASGTVTFQLTQTMRNAGVTYPAKTPVTATLTAGAFSITLPANDDSGTVPDGSAYLVAEAIGDAEETSTITIPASEAGQTIDLASLLPSVVATA